MSAPAQRRRRVFFALWPGRRLAADLAALARGSGLRGRAMRRETLHLTLAFVGAVAEARLAELAAIAAAVRGHPFELVLDRLECRPRQRMLWACAGAIPQPLLDLVAMLNEGLAAAAFPVERRPFGAHVTLMRDCRCEAAPALPDPLGWRVKEFVLAESRTDPEGASYGVLSRWPLAGAPAVTGR